MSENKAPPADWVLIEAAKRGGYSPEFRWLKAQYEDNPLYRALCDMIERYEQPPVDRKLLCAREAIEEAVRARVGWSQAEVCVRAIELFEQGFGK